jgi:Putative Actinobacterial Holin-X, holin superfamily III
MGHILRNLLWTATISRGAGEMRQALRRAKRRAGLIGLGLALGLVGAGFLVAAGYMALAEFVGALYACLIIGAVLVLAGGVAFLVARGRRIAAGDRSADTPLATTLIDVGRDLGAAASRNPGSFVIAAFLIGLLLGRTRR